MIYRVIRPKGGHRKSLDQHANPRSSRAYAANDKIVFAQIGLGGRGKSVGREFARIEGVEMKYCCDVDFERAGGFPDQVAAAHGGTIQGVETNSMQFYPEASAAEAKIHPGIYSRNDGKVDLTSIQGSGFGYRLDEIERELPEPAIVCETSAN